MVKLKVNAVAQLRRRSRHAAVVVLARHTRTDGNKVWLRHGPLRRVYRASERRSDPIVHHADERGGG